VTDVRMLTVDVVDTVTDRRGGIAREVRRLLRPSADVLPLAAHRTAGR
jgi:hypothetical protein